MSTRETKSKPPLFKNQAIAWLEQSKNRNRRPIRQNTYRTFESQLKKNLIPELGELKINEIGNLRLKQLAEKMTTEGMSPATIRLNLSIVKKIRASVKNEDGELYPYKWDHETIDAPVVQKDLQKRPVATAEAVSSALKCGPRRMRALVALLAGSGLRIAEAMAIRLGPDDGVNTIWTPKSQKLIVRNQRSRFGQFETPKTSAGVREVDICVELDNYLRIMLEYEFLDDPEPQGKLLFPESDSMYRILFRKCGLIGGFHSLRRFRVTHLRMQGIPDSLVHFWIGHEDSTVTGRYTEIGTEIHERRVRANNVGLGFVIPKNCSENT